MTARSPLILAAAVTGLLVACGPAASNEAPSTSAPIAPAADGSAPASPDAPSSQAMSVPRPTVGYDWDTRVTDEGRSRSMTLAYEVPETDDQPMNLVCEEGGGSIFAGTRTSNTDLSSITLASAGVSQIYPVKEAVADELDGGEYVTVELAGDDETLTAFRDSGWLRLTVDDNTTDMAAQPNSEARQKIAAFMTFCNAPYVRP